MQREILGSYSCHGLFFCLTLALLCQCRGQPYNSPVTSTHFSCFTQHSSSGSMTEKRSGLMSLKHFCLQPGFTHYQIQCQSNIYMKINNIVVVKCNLHNSRLMWISCTGSLYLHCLGSHFFFLGNLSLFWSCIYLNNY